MIGRVASCRAVVGGPALFKPRRPAGLRRRPVAMSGSGAFSSRTFSPGDSGPRPRVGSKVGPSGKSKEKEDMVGLNDKFVQIIDKMKNLEDENRKLTTKLKILKEYEVYKGTVDDIVKQEENDLEQQVEHLLHDKEKLQAELDDNEEEKEKTKKRYSDALEKKDDLERDFIITKKELDNSHLENVQLALDLENLMRKLEFLRVGYDEEMKELESQIQNKTVVLPNNSKRSLDMEDIIQNVKIQYENMAAQAREHAEHWYQKKMDTMVIKAEQHEQNVRDIKRDIADLVRQIQRLSGDLDSLRRKEDSLKKEINDVRTESDENMDKGREDITKLENALRQAKQDLTGLIREQQELMNIKLALDIEIATYRKLLEGEEKRIKNFMPSYEDLHLPEKPHLPSQPEKPQALNPTNVLPTTIIPPEAHIPDVCPVSKKRLLIRVNVESGRVLSERVFYTEE